MFMTWWQVLPVFVGIPVVMFVLITVVVLRFTTPRVPDGLLRVAEQQDGDDPSPEEDDGATDADT
jgi:hypothetical protein